MSESQELADHLDRAVTEYQNQAKRRIEEEPDHSIRRIRWNQLERDCSELRYLADLVRQGNIRAARRILAKLPNVVREVIPTEVHRFILTFG